MTTNSCAAHTVYRESRTRHEDIRSSRAAGDAVLEFGGFRLLLRRRQLIAEVVPIEVACPMDFATTARSACLEVAPCTH